MDKILERNKRLIKDYLGGSTIKNLTRKYGLKYNDIKYILAYNNIAIRRGGRPKSKVKLPDLLKIKNLILDYFSQGESISSLAVRFNATIDQISKIINRKYG